MDGEEENQLTVTGGRFQSNTAKLGGGISLAHYVETVLDEGGFTVDINDVVVTNNEAAEGGGGIFVSTPNYQDETRGTVALRNSVVSFNEVLGVPDKGLPEGHGGGIYTSMIGRLGASMAAWDITRLISTNAYSFR